MSAPVTRMLWGTGALMFLGVSARDPHAFDGAIDVDEGK